MSVLLENGEIDLQVNRKNITSFGGMEQWQAEALLNKTKRKDLLSQAASLRIIDEIALNWVSSLSKEEVEKILRQKSLFGIKIPEEWVKVWRYILKEPELRDPNAAVDIGSSIDSYIYLWRLGIEKEFDSFFNEMEREIIELVNLNTPYIDIGIEMYEKYGSDFWKKRKEKSTTTLSQIVNNYMHMSLPTKAAKQNLYNLVVKTFKK